MRCAGADRKFKKTDCRRLLDVPDPLVAARFGAFRIGPAHRLRGEGSRRDEGGGRRRFAPFDRRIEAAAVSPFLRRRSRSGGRSVHRLERSREREVAAGEPDSGRPHELGAGRDARRTLARRAAADRGAGRRERERAGLGAGSPRSTDSPTRPRSPPTSAPRRRAARGRSSASGPKRISRTRR